MNSNIKISNPYSLMKTSSKDRYTGISKNMINTHKIMRSRLRVHNGSHCTCNILRNMLWSSVRLNCADWILLSLCIGQNKCDIIIYYSPTML